MSHTIPIVTWAEDPAWDQSTIFINPSPDVFSPLSFWNGRICTNETRWKEANGFISTYTLLRIIDIHTNPTTASPSESSVSSPLLSHGPKGPLSASS